MNWYQDFDTQCTLTVELKKFGHIVNFSFKKINFETVMFILETFTACNSQEMTFSPSSNVNILTETRATSSVLPLWVRYGAAPPFLCLSIR